MTDRPHESHVDEPPRPEAEGGPSVAIIIPAYTMRRWRLIKKAVESARRQTAAVEEIVLCVDNNDELLAKARDEWDGRPGTPLRVIPNRQSEHLSGDDLKLHVRAHGERRRFGAGSARNTAVEAVSADIVAFMDDDAWAEADWIEQLLAVYDSAGARAVGGAPVADFESHRPPWYPAGFDWVFGCAYEGLPTVPAPLRRLIGANMSIRRDALDAVGGFHGDEFDDLNVCMRVAERYGNESIYYAPAAVVHHHVTEQRVTWRYFCRRCFFVNRQKVRSFREMGSAASLGDERSFVLRTLRVRTAAEVRRGLSGDPAAFLALGASFAGIFLAGLGHLRGRLDHYLRPRGPAT